MPYGALTPYRWPQDELASPDGHGVMPIVEGNNGKVIGQESFTLSTEFNLNGPLAAGTTFNNIIPTDQDGDFWVDQIYAVGRFAGTEANTMTAALVGFQDLRTGTQLFFPSMLPIQFFNGAAINEDLGFGAGNFPLPSGFRPIGTLMQPYCFTRQGGIRVTLQSIFGVAGANNFVVSLSFGGWKEYTYASR